MTACRPSRGDPPEAPRRLRADAARNRAAIVAVARDVFAEQGLEAPLEAIAARAGVGIATLYRRFPTREKLVAAALVEKIAAYAEAAEQALAVADPWQGFAGFVLRSCELQAGDRGLSDLLSMTLSADEHVEQLRRTANDRVIVLIDRAMAQGPRARAHCHGRGHACHPDGCPRRLAAVCRPDARRIPVP
jgi:AcrR family transcriptional regulator